MWKGNKTLQCGFDKNLLVGTTKIQRGIKGVKN